MNEIRKALVQMGYHEQFPGKWMKPIGWQIFAFLEDKNEWSNWFKNIRGEICLWDSKIVDSSSDYLEQLKTIECFTRINFNCNYNSSFELSDFDFVWYNL